VTSFMVISWFMFERMRESDKNLAMMARMLYSDLALT
jgi:hypothetical protein